MSYMKTSSGIGVLIGDQVSYYIRGIAYNKITLPTAEKVWDQVRTQVELGVKDQVWGHVKNENK
jgi:hypothetical protein